MRHHRMRRIGSVAGVVILGASFGWPVSAQDASAPPVAEIQPTLTDSIDRSIAAAAVVFDGDPAAARGFVIERIEPESYVGSLKGPRGTLLTGAANDVDSAQLLAALLSRDGVPAVRYAACTITAVAPATTEGVEPAPPALALDFADAIAAEVTDPALKAAILELRDLRAATRAGAQRSADALAVELARAPAPTGATAPLAGPRQHVWLQVEGPDATWIDVDPTTATGAPPCAAESTVDSRPSADDHRVTIRLVVEQRRAGALVEWTALESSAPTADLAAARITFGFNAADGPGLVAWTPELRIDNVPLLGLPIALPAVPPPPDAEGGIDLDPFGHDGTGPGPSSSPTPESDPVTAAWLEIELASPTGITTLRSDVFDRIGIVARTDGNATEAPVMALDGMEGGAAVLAARWQIGLLLGDLRVTEELVDSDLDLRTTDGMAGRVDALLRLFPSLRRDLGGSPATGPIVLLAGLADVTGPEKRGGLEPGEVITQLVFDALSVPVAAPRDVKEAARDAAAIVAAEGMLIAIAGFTPHPFGSADAVFTAAAKAGTPLVLLAPGDAPVIAGASPRALARMDARLADGDWILTPAVPPAMYGTARTAWFAIDPVTGIVRDEHENGRHNAMADDVTNRTAGPSGFQRFCALAERLGRPLGLAAYLAISLVPGSVGKPVEAGLKELVKVTTTKEVDRRKREIALQVACHI